MNLKGAPGHGGGGGGAQLAPTCPAHDRTPKAVHHNKSAQCRPARAGSARIGDLAWHPPQGRACPVRHPVRGHPRSPTHARKHTCSQTFRHLLDGVVTKGNIARRLPRSAQGLRRVVHGLEPLTGIVDQGDDRDRLVRALARERRPPGDVRVHACRCVCAWAGGLQRLRSRSRLSSRKRPPPPQNLHGPSCAGGEGLKQGAARDLS